MRIWLVIAGRPLRVAPFFAFFGSKVNMKTISPFLLCLLVLPLQSQELALNEVDEFTGARKVQTAWEDFNGYGSGRYRFTSVDGHIILDYRKTTKRAVWAGPEHPLMIKFSDGEVIELMPIEVVYSCVGCGAIGLVGSSAVGIEIRYALGDEQLEKLKRVDVEKIRAYTSDGYIEESVKKKKKRALVKQCAQLVGTGG